jgi:hypothetical protein
MELARTRRWLRPQLGGDVSPVWLLPCRLLRRKNVAEALLLTRWLRPEAWLIVTGGPSSADERPYADALARAAQQHRWRLRLGVLRNNRPSDPTVNELLAASEAVLLTSIVEGFGLPYLEAVAARRPLIARSLPNIAPDLERFGFRCPQPYDELLVDPSLFDWPAEVDRQKTLFHAWRRDLPRACRRMAGEPVLLATGANHCPVPFSRLTLSAQLEVLAQPIELSWSLCAPLNPWLEIWRRRAVSGKLLAAPWPRSAAQWLSGPAYARRFAESVAAKMPQNPRTNLAAQQAFIRSRLDTAHLFPLLWSNRT